MRKPACPFCYGKVDPRASICRHCRRDIVPFASVTVKTPWEKWIEHCDDIGLPKELRSQWWKDYQSKKFNIFVAYMLMTFIFLGVWYYWFASLNDDGNRKDQGHLMLFMMGIIILASSTYSITCFISWKRELVPDERANLEENTRLGAVIIGLILAIAFGVRQFLN